MELDEMSKAMQSSCGSRAAQETSLLWLQLTHLVLVNGGADLDKVMDKIRFKVRLASISGVFFHHISGVRKCHRTPTH